MNKIRTILALCCVTASSVACGQDPGLELDLAALLSGREKTRPADDCSWTPEQVVVGLVQTGPEQRSRAIDALEKIGLRIATDPACHASVILAHVPPGASTAIRRLIDAERLPGILRELVEFAEPNFRFEPAQAAHSTRPPSYASACVATTDDPYLQWGLARIGLRHAWAGGRCGSKEVLVSVVDSGLSPATCGDMCDNDENRWREEIAGATRFGRSFCAGCSGHDPWSVDDELGHGSSMFEIIGATVDNQRGVAGINQTASLQTAKFIWKRQDGNYGEAYDAACAIDFARTSNARILNASWGSACRSEAVLGALQRAKDDLLVVAAAGNSSVDIDLAQNHFYPASFKAEGLANMIVVGATDHLDTRVPSTAWGVQTVDLGAPGKQVRDSNGGCLWGTSAATAFVTGTAAVVAAAATGPSPPTRLREAILEGASYVPALEKLFSNGRLLNACGAVNKVLEQSQQLSCTAIPFTDPTC